MQSDKVLILEDYKNKIRNEVHNVIQNPLTYDTAHLLDILDDIELNPHVNSHPKKLSVRSLLLTIPHTLLLFTS
jgi:hypothetical protein